MPWAGIGYSGSAFQLRMRSRTLQFPETRNWQWRGQQYSVSAAPIIRGVTIQSPGEGGGTEVYVADK